MPDLIKWMMVFLRVSAMLAIFPVFSARNFPVQLRLALGALMALLVGATLPVTVHLSGDFLGMVGAMIVEVGIGLMLGFTSRMVFFAIEMAGGMISTEIGLNLPPVSIQCLTLRLRRLVPCSITSQPCCFLPWICIIGCWWVFRKPTVICPSAVAIFPKCC